MPQCPGWRIALLCLCLCLAGLAACSSGGVGRPPDPDPDDPDPYPVDENPSISALEPSSGPVGTPVTIQGNRFSLIANLNEVRFGDMLAPIVSARPNQIVVVVPEKAVTSFVTVTVDGRTSNGELFIVTSMLNTRRVSGIVPGGDQIVWLGTRGGLALLDTGTGAYKNFYYDDGLKSDYVLDLIPWADGLLVLTNKGLQYLAGTVEDPVIGDVCPSVTFAGFERHLDRIVPGPDGRVYFGSAHYGLVEISGDPLDAQCDFFPWEALPVEYDGEIEYDPYIGIVDMASAPDGKIWMIYDVPYWESRLAVFRPIPGMPGLFDLIQFARPDFPPEVRELFSVVVTEDGIVYVGTDGGHFRIEGDPFESLKLGALSPVRADILAYEQEVTPEGDLVLATFDEGLVLFDPNGGPDEEGSFLPIPREDGWFTSDFDEARVTNLAFSPGGDLLIGTVDGVSVLTGDYEAPVYEDFTTGVAFPQDFISDMVVDDMGNLVSIDLNSLCVLVGLLDPAGPDFRYLPNINSWSWGDDPLLRAGLFNVSLANCPDGRVARGTEHSVTLFDFASDYTEFESVTCSLEEEVDEAEAYGDAWPPWINDVSVRDDGAVFLGTSDGVCLLEEEAGAPGDRYTCPVYRDGGVRDEVRHIAFDHDGNLIIGTWCEGIWAYDVDDEELTWHPLTWVSPSDRAACKEYRYFPGEGVREFFYVADSVLSMAVGDSAIYVGTTRGLYVLDPGTKNIIEHFPFLEIAKRNDITSLAIDTEGNVFMVRANLHVGYPDYRDDILSVFNGDLANPRFIDVHQGEGLPSSPYRSLVVLPGEKGVEEGTNLYISVNDGGGLAYMLFYRPLFDADGDGVPDCQDPDDDGDGIPDVVDPYPDRKSEPEM